MIRLGSLAGYLFDGPRLLGGWTPPGTPGVYAILYRPEPQVHPDHYAVIFAGQSDNLAEEGFPFRHPKAPCWVRRAGSQWRVHIATFEVPGGGRRHREQIVGELIAIYEPRCNTEKYAPACKDEWISRTPRDGPMCHEGRFPVVE